MQASGLIEFASHTHDLHHGIPGNPQGNAQPAAVTRQFDPAVSYEDDTTWRRRIESDLARSADIIRRKLGRPPRALVWPYGRYNGDAVAIAARVGMPLTLTLNPEPGRLGGMDRIGRLLLMGDPSVGELERAMRFAAPQRERVLHVDLDHVHDDDPMQAARNLDALIERVARLGPSTVYLQAYADPDGDGVAEALYFPNRFLPMRADLFNRVAWQLSTRANVSVFAWMPLLAFRLGDDNDLVLVANDGPPAPASDEYRRLSPFAPRARDWILGLYEDLARHCQCAGLLFHDDAFLSDYEDANPAALRAYQAAGLPGDIAAIRADPAAMRRWTALKTSALIDLSRAAHQAAERWRAPLQTARNMYARPVLEPQSEAWFAQSLPAFVAAYDRVAIMAMPYMENAPDAGAFLRALYAAVAMLPGAISKTVFELQAVDWRQRPAQPVPSARLRAQLRLLQQLGAHHIGWYPDDFLHGHPDAVIIGDAISARGFPWRP
jgi:biofilm PGA synthesis lipoprotein PgaB